MRTVTFQMWDVSEKLPEPYQLLFLYLQNNRQCVGFYSGKIFVEISTFYHLEGGNWYDLSDGVVLGWRYLNDTIEEKYKTSNGGQIL